MNTMTNYDSIDEALNTTSAIDAKPVSTPKKVKKLMILKKIMITLVLIFIH